jgi:hypothetical protein
MMMMMMMMMMMTVPSFLHRFYRGQVLSEVHHHHHHHHHHIIIKPEVADLQEGGRDREFRAVSVTPDVQRLDPELDHQWYPVQGGDPSAAHRRQLGRDAPAHVAQEDHLRLQG